MFQVGAEDPVLELGNHRVAVLGTFLDVCGTPDDSRDLLAHDGLVGGDEDLFKERERETRDESQLNE